MSSLQNPETCKKTSDTSFMSDSFINGSGMFRKLYYTDEYTLGHKLSILYSRIGFNRLDYVDTSARRVRLNEVLRIR